MVVDIAKKNKEKLESIESWWNGENSRPLIMHDPRGDNERVSKLKATLNTFWPTVDAEPDYEGFVKTLDEIEQITNRGDRLSATPHCFGDRGTPLTMACYLGGDVRFTDDTVWVEPVIKQWSDFEIKFDVDNIWWKRSLALLEKSCELLHDRCFVRMPDFGDALTCFSLLRGTENLLFDLMDNKQTVLKARDKFVEARSMYHDACWKVYSRYYPGDCTWLSWGPAKTIVAMCDFCTMISPELFKEFVVPELETYNEYFDYIVWHLDGPDEVRHLDILLDLPFVKAIQWEPGAGSPTAGHWLELLKKIQSKGKSIYCYSESKEETQLLTKELLTEGLAVFER